ncbi:MAG TPA: hypothetical protein VMK12_29305 [Anaeromyxobacteraceae bacterium]|nr:hypothetical protein [Anaeromyxobacteraceae bacterium]
MLLFFDCGDVLRPSIAGALAASVADELLFVCGKLRGKESVERLPTFALRANGTNQIAGAAFAVLPTADGHCIFVRSLRGVPWSARLGWRAVRGSNRASRRLLGEGEPLVRAAALDALGIRGRAPEVQAAVCAARRSAHGAVMEAEVEFAAPQVRDAALEAGISLPRAPGLAARELVESCHLGSDIAFPILAMRSEPSEPERIGGGSEAVSCAAPPPVGARGAQFRSGHRNGVLTEPIPIGELSLSGQRRETAPTHIRG